MSPGDSAKARTGADFEQPDVELVQRKLLRVIGEDRGFESLAGLGLKIVDVVEADSAEPVPVRPGKKGAVDRSAGSEHGLRSGAKAGIALIAQAGLREAGELIGLQLFVGEREQVLDLLAQLGRDVGRFANSRAPARRSRADNKARRAGSAWRQA